MMLKLGGPGLESPDEPLLQLLQPQTISLSGKRLIVCRTKHWLTAGLEAHTERKHICCYQSLCPPVGLHISSLQGLNYTRN